MLGALFRYARSQRLVPCEHVRPEEPMDACTRVPNKIHQDTYCGSKAVAALFKHGDFVAAAFAFLHVPFLE